MSRDMSYLDTLDEETLKAAIKTLEKLETLSKRTQKETLLFEEKANPVLQEFFYRSLGRDKYYVRSLSEDIQSSETRLDLVDSFKKFLKALSALNARKVDNPRSRVEGFLSKCHPRVRKWYMRVLDHDLRLGVSKNTVEKIYGTGFWFGAAEDEFHYHGCCLAKKFEDVYKGDETPEFPVAAEFKLDGERALIFVFPDGAPGGNGAEDRIRVYTRGRLRKNKIEEVRELSDQFISFAGILNELIGKPKNTPLFLDGEFLALNWNKTSSVVDSTENFDEEAFLSAIKVILFDWSTIEGYTQKAFSVQWRERKKLLMRAAGAVRPYEKVRQATNNIYVLGHRILKGMDDLEFFFGRSLDGGFEGIMLKELMAPHVFHRKHKFVLKLKPEDSDTGTIVGFVGGNKQHAAADLEVLRKVRQWMEKAGDVEDDGYYLHLTVDNPEEAAEQLRALVNDVRDRRITTHLENVVSYRYSERLGAFIVDTSAGQVHVGGGFTFKAGQDQRMEFWKQKDELLGKKLDFKLQKDKSQVAKARFNRFVRLREDLSEPREVS